MYTDAKKVNLSEIQNEYSLYNLIRAIKRVNLIFASFYKLYLEKKIKKKANILILFNLIKSFRNHIRINRTESKALSHTAFAILQEESTESPADTQFSEKLTPLSSRFCLYSEIHSYFSCSYIIK